MSHTIPKGSQLALLLQVPEHAITGRQNSGLEYITNVHDMRIDHCQAKHI